MFEVETNMLFWGAERRGLGAGFGLGDGGEADGPLVSGAAESSVTAAFNALLASRLAQQSEIIIDLTRETLRPMLKAWLADNLSSWSAWSAPKSSG
jgi:hypothetical protein